MAEFLGTLWMPFPNELTMLAGATGQAGKGNQQVS